MKSIVITFSFLISVLFSFGQLTGSQKYDISFMREEEKLARDVYDSLYSKWGLRPFANIRESEQRHMDRVLSLIKSYGLTDPVEKTADMPGKFMDKIITEYYSALVTEGSKSAIDALKVGAKIEEIDIRDLLEKSKNFKDPEVLNAFKYLREASERHLNAFVRNLRFRGENYEPVILDKTYYDEIIENE